MALDTYPALKTSIATWAMRTGDPEYEAAIPDFIDLVERRLNRTLRVAEMEVTGPVTLTDGAGTLPADFLEARRAVAGSPSYALELVAPGFATDEYPTNYGGYARHFSVIGNTLQTYPSSAGPVSLTYYAKIPALSDANTTNWLLDKAPDLYLYGALLEGAPFMLEDPRLQTWTLLFQKGLADLQADDKGKRWAGSRARVSGPTP